MPKITYIERRFSKKTMAIITLANEIISEYQAQGFDLTLRQLYYQLVARDYIPNKQTEYKKLSVTIKNARLAGLVDWDAIVDRTREVRENPHWSSPKQIIKSAELGYSIDKWEGQPIRPEVWKYGRLSDCKNTSNHFSERSLKLDWSHYHKIYKLDKDNSDYWLQQAEQNKWSVVNRCLGVTLRA